MKDHQATLIRLINENNYQLMAEVGVASGNTSEILLYECPKLNMVLVDQWKAPDSHPRKEAVQERMERAVVDLSKRLSFASNRFTIRRGQSVSVASRVRKPFDLVFIDAHHGYESVLADCRAWYHKIRHGGILCGHDIDSPKDLSGVWGVRKAVTEFAAEVNKTFTVDKNVWIMRI